MSEPIYNASTKEQIALMKSVTEMTGGLHEFQVKHLKLWPLLVFEGATKSEFTWKPNDKLVIFRVKGCNDKPTEWLKERLQILQGWVQGMVGQDWICRLEVRGRKLTADKVKDVSSNANKGTEGKPADGA